MNYYNENEPFAADWLENLIRAGVLPRGDVDRRSIIDVKAGDLHGYTQCHFFAGIGGWSHALRLAGWDTSRPVWTGSCPCQPFSGAGRGKGINDERHLWPWFAELILQCHPAVVFGEQVASPAGRSWLSGVRADMEEVGYGFGAADLCAASVGAPHTRQRLYWVAESDSQRCQRERLHVQAWGSKSGVSQVEGSGDNGGLGITASSGRVEECPHTGGSAAGSGAQGSEQRLGDDSGDSRVADSEGCRRQEGAAQGSRAECEGNGSPDGGRLGNASGAGTGRDGRAILRTKTPGKSKRQHPWGLRNGSIDAGAAIYCADAKYRRIEPSLEPLVDGAPGRVGRVRAYGNAIVPQVAAEFIGAYADA